MPPTRPGSSTATSSRRTCCLRRRRRASAPGSSDFGIGMLMERGPEGQRLTADRQVIGTASLHLAGAGRAANPSTRAPTSTRSAALAFEMLTGTVPFAGDTQLATLPAHGSAPRPSASAVDGSLPAGVDAALAAAMAIEPAAAPGERLRLRRGARQRARRPQDRADRAPAAADRKPTAPLPVAAGRGAAATLRSGRAGGRCCCWPSPSLARRPAARRRRRSRDRDLAGGLDRSTSRATRSRSRRAPTSCGLPRRRPTGSAPGTPRRRAGTRSA